MPPDWKYPWFITNIPGFFNVGNNNSSKTLKQESPDKVNFMLYYQGNDSNDSSYEVQ